MKTDYNFVLAYRNERLSRPTKESAQAWVNNIHAKNSNAFIVVDAWGLSRRPTAEEMDKILDAHGLRRPSGLGIYVK